MDGEFATIVIISLIIGIVLFGINFLENNSIWLFQFLVDGGEIDIDTVGCNDETTKNIIANNNDYSPAQVMLAA